MKRIFFFCLLMIISHFCVFSQSPELTSAYKQVCTTLKEYKFTSNDVYSGGGNGRTKSISLSCQNGVLIFSFNDNYGAFSDPFFGHRHGIITIKVALADARFYMPSYGSYMSITDNDRNGVELTYKKQKEIIDGYQIHGSEGSLKKLYNELNELLSIAIKEDFTGSLGVASNNKTAKRPNQPNGKTQNTNKPKKNVGKYVQ